MDGVKTRSGANKVFWSIFDGRLARRVPQHTEGARARTNKNNVVVYELFADSIEGKLKDVYIQEGDYGRQLAVDIQTPTLLHVINVPWKSKYRNSLVEKLPNMSAGDNIEFTPYNFADKKNPDKKIIGISIKHENLGKVKSYFKETIGEKTTSINGYPSMPKQWNEMSVKEQGIFFLEMDEFIENTLNEWRGKNAPKYNAESHNDEPPATDDLPF